MSEVKRFETLEELLANSDVLSLHVPLNDETRDLLDARALGLLPEDAILVNTARGEIVDENALVAALTTGRLAGAALDVIHNERDPQARYASPLVAYARTHDNLLLTPHIGGATFESMTKTEVFMALKLAAFVQTLGANSYSI